MEPKEGETAPKARTAPVPGRREAGARLAGKPRRGVSPEERRHRAQLDESQGVPEEPSAL